MQKARRLFLLDANALLHRAWHALPPLTNPEGMVVHAVYGVMMIVMKLIEAEKPDAMVACWDTEAATFRHEAFAAYKAQRKEQPDELYSQIPLIQEGLTHLGIESRSLDGYEADDLIGTLALRAKRAHWNVVIVTSDRDALQLVRPGITVMAFKKGVSETVLYDESSVLAQYGISPQQFVDFKILRGDPSDNIPGIKGIGEKSATELLQTYEDIRGIFAAVHDASSSLSAGLRSKLLAGEQDVKGLESLVTVRTDVPIAWDVDAHPPKIEGNADIREFFVRMGFTSLVKRLDQSFSTHPQDGKKDEPAKSQRAKTSSSAAPIRRITSESDIRTLFDSIRSTGSVVVRVARGLEGSLFAGTVDGIAFGVGSDVTLLRSDKIRGSVKDELQSLFDDGRIRKIAHDAKQETRALTGLELSQEEWGFDTMLAAYLLGAGERNYDLPTVAARYADYILPTGASREEETAAILALVDPMTDALTQEGALAVLERIELPLIPVLARMERAGILLDSGYLQTLQDSMSKEKAKLESKMVKSVGRLFNPASPIQLAEVLFTDLRLPTKGIKRGKTGFSTAATELEKLRGTHPIIEMIEEHRELSKLLSTYVEVLPTLVDAHGRVHTTFNQAIAATGRLSSSDPNLQNIPARTEVGRQIRAAFIAPQGRVLLGCDYSQIELRLVAALAQDKAMLEAFRSGEDIHASTAAAIWGVPLPKVTKDQRRAAKAINFGILYGQGPYALASGAGISFAEAKEFIAKYFEIYHGVKRYLEKTKAFAKKHEYVETFFGRKRPLPEINSPLPQLRAQAERMAINMPAQGTAADLMKLAMIQVDAGLAEVCADASILLQVHDELVIEVPEKNVVEVARFVKKAMEHVEDLGVPIVVEAKSGKNWSEMESIDVSD